MSRHTLPDGRVLSFPDNTHPDVIERKKRELGGGTTGPAPEASPVDARREMGIESALAMVQAAASTNQQTAHQLASMIAHSDAAFAKLEPALEAVDRLEKAITGAFKCLTKLEKALSGLGDSSTLADVLKTAIDEARSDIVTAVMAPVILDKKAGQVTGSHKEASQ